MTAGDPPLLELTVGPVAHGGHFVARHEGRVVFVRHALPGEVVRARLTEADPGATFWRADAVEVLEAGADRVPHIWAKADPLHGRVPVGGAEFGHISRTGQRRLKAEVLAEQLRRLAGVDEDSRFLQTEVEDVDGSGTEEEQAGLHWRTRAGFSVTTAGRLGMHAHRSEKVLPITDMPLAVQGINALRLWDLELSGVERIEVAAPANGSPPMVLLALDPALGAKAAGRVLKQVAAAIGPAASVARWDADAGTVQQVHGRSWVAETALGHEFRVTGDGFWQIHRRAPSVLATAVLDFLDGYLPPGAAVADLYAGAGLFTAPLADAVGPAGSVLSIEGSPGASRDARKNLHAAAQVDIRQGRVERALRDYARSGGRPLEAVVLDPPRAGAGKAVVRQLAGSGAKAIVYISCDPASFARDVGDFARHGWSLARLHAFDLYPHTHHLESAALLLPHGGATA